MTFREWIEATTPADDPNGDFIEDTRCLYRVGKGPSPGTEAELVSFVLLRRGCQEAVAAARKVWRAYARQA